MQCPNCKSLVSSFDTECQHCGSKLSPISIDITAIKHKVKSILEKKCPNCGAPLKSNTCEFCGSQFIGVTQDEAPARLNGFNDCAGTCMSTCTTACVGTCSGSCTGTSTSAR